MGFFDKVKDVADTLVDSVEKGAKNVSETSKKTADKMRIKKEIILKEIFFSVVFWEKDSLWIYNHDKE